MNTPSFLKRFGSLALFGAILAITGCGGSGGGGGGGASTGTLSLQITDGPVDTAEHVYIQFSGLEIQAADGKRTTLYYCQDPADATKTILKDTACTTLVAPKQLDLLMLSGGQTDLLLDSFTLPSGHYSWIRLMVDTDSVRDSYIVLLDGAEQELTIPSGDQTGLKLNRGFDVPAGGSADFTVDFDLRKSVYVTGTGEYMLRPTLRMVDNMMVGSISGTVDNTLMTVTCDPVNDHPAVYVFSGAGITPDDIDGIAPDPVSTASVKLDNMGVYRYKAAFLEAGSYTIAFTCDAVADDPTVDNALTFSGTTTVSVTANTSTMHNF
jgi:hypothetical protein